VGQRAGFLEHTWWTAAAATAAAVAHEDIHRFKHRGVHAVAVHEVRDVDFGVAARGVAVGEQACVGEFVAEGVGQDHDVACCSGVVGGWGAIAAREDGGGGRVAV